MTTAMTTPALASLEAIRARFPALERLQSGLPVAYFDGPGGTQVPRSVADAVSDYLLHHNANTHWAYPTSAETDAALDAARAALADFLGGRPSEIAFGANMTTLTLHLGRALGRGWKVGDEIVVTELDHHANSDTWRQVAKERGLHVKAVRFHRETGQLEMDALAAAIGPKTRLVAIGAASNALGTINDVRQAAELAHAAGALVFVDAVHYAPHMLVDVQALGADFLACSAYKFYGPHVGVLWGRQPLVDALDLPRLEPAPSTSPESLETGTQNHEGIVGAAAAVDFLASLAEGPDRRARLAAAFAGLHARGQQLFEKLWSGLREIESVSVYGPPPGAPRTPTVSFALNGVPSEAVARALAERAVFVSHGDFYATTVVTRLGHAEDGVVRAGCACYTSADDVERLLAGVRTLAARSARP
jgi:cysteine desulfurase family protein (TIGR01976 family)